MKDVPWTGLDSMINDIRAAWGDIAEIQTAMLSVTGVGHAAGDLIRAEVGPRGQLIALDIDQTHLRTIDARALTDDILAAVRLAVDDAGRQTTEALNSALAKDLAVDRLGGAGLQDLLHSHDADLSEHQRRRHD